MKRKDTNQWHERQSVIIVLLLIFIYPVGLYLMWRYAVWSKRTKVSISIATAFIVLIPMLGYISMLSDDDLSSKQHSISSNQQEAQENASPKPTDTTPKPKTLYKDFYKWVTTDRQDTMLKNVGNAYQIIAATCQSRDSSYGATWTACMQEGYKDYLKPEIFANNNWQGDYSNMMGYINDAIAQKNWNGSASESDQYKKDMQEAEKIYNRIALTN